MLQVVLKVTPETPPRSRTSRSLRVMSATASLFPSTWCSHGCSPAPRWRPPTSKSVSCYWIYYYYYLFFYINADDFTFILVMIPRCFCPGGDVYLLSEFEVNVVIVLHDDHLITENFPLKLCRVWTSEPRQKPCWFWPMRLDRQAEVVQDRTGNGPDTEFL